MRGGDGAPECHVYGEVRRRGAAKVDVCGVEHDPTVQGHTQEGGGLEELAEMYTVHPPRVGEKGVDEFPQVVTLLSSRDPGALNYNL